mmetsp:Transcript_7887/g.11927  ORF Transcript_7887/g.11927 Transcript_7887/m.11927 type:complete len:686 (-) Transcript_7887:127-2184(-)
MEDAKFIRKIVLSGEKNLDDSDECDETFDGRDGKWINSNDPIHKKESIPLDPGCVSGTSSAGGRLESSKHGSLLFSENKSEFETIYEKFPRRQSSIKFSAPKLKKIQTKPQAERWIMAYKQAANKSKKNQEVIYENDVDVPDENHNGSAAEVVVQSHTRKIRAKKQNRRKKLTRSVTLSNRKQRRYGTVMSQTPDNDEYLLSLGMMVGLRVSVGRQENPAEKGELTLADFYQVDKYIFPPSGGKGLMVTPAHSLGHTFKFKEYAPKVFKNLRKHFNIDKMHYMLSVAGNCDFLEFFSNAKSGEFFFYSHDECFMIKTMKKTETKFLRRILPYYYEHMKKEPNSLLVRFCGMYRVKMHHIRRMVHFMVMHSVFDTPKEMHSIFDLKGSTVGRSKKEGQKVGKDNDLVAAGTKLHLGRQKDKFVKIIKKDVQFLSKMKIMDYSLLLGIHDRTRPFVPTVSTRDYHDGKYIDEEDAENGAKKLNSFRLSGRFRSGRQGSTSSMNLPDSSSISEYSSDISDDESEASESNRKANEGDDDVENGEMRDIDLKNFMGFKHGEGSNTESAVSINQSMLNSVSTLSTVTDTKGSTGTFNIGSSSAMDNESFEDKRLKRRKDFGINSEISGTVGYRRGREVYYMGIIDILQEYNMRKHAETAVKSLRQNRSNISCVDPELYANRFLSFLTEHTD